MSTSGTNIGFCLDGQRVYIAESGRLISSPAGVTADTALTGPMIKQIVDQSGASSKAVAAALPAKDSIVRCFEMPLLPKKEWATAVRYEAQKYLPFETKDLYFDYDTVLDKKRNRMMVMFLAAKKQAVDDFLALLLSSGLTVESLEPASFSLWRAYNSEKSQAHPKEGMCATLNLTDGNILKIMIVKNNLMLITQDIVLSAVTFEAFLTEVRLSFNYLSKNFREEGPVSRVILCAGAGEQFRRWDELLHQELGVPIEKGRSIGQRDNEPLMTSGMAIACGLSIKSRFEDRKKLNLIPTSAASLARPSRAVALSDNDEKRLMKKWVIIEAAVIWGILLMLYFVQNVRAASYTSAIQSIKTSHANVPSAPDSLSLDDLKVKKADADKKLSFITTLMDRRAYLTAKMSAIAETIPENILLKAMDYTDNEAHGGQRVLSLRMEGDVLPEGSGSELGLINTFVQRLKENKEFMQGLDEIKINSLTKATDKNNASVHFVLTCASPREAG